MLGSLQTTVPHSVAQGKGPPRRNGVTMGVTDMTMDLVRSWSAAGNAAASGLTGRELAVLAELITGATNQDIARELFLSQRTVEAYVARILMKLGARNRTEAAYMVLTEGAGMANERAWAEQTA